MAKTISRELSLRGFEVYVSCETKLLKLQSSQDYYGAKLVYFPIIESVRNFSEPFLYDTLSILWSSLQVDLILMLGCYFPPPLIIPRLLRRVVFINVDGMEWKRRKFGALLRYQLKQFAGLNSKLANLIIVDSPLIGEYYRQNFGTTPSYVPIGVEEIQPLDKEGLTRFNLSARGYYLVIARLEPENNIQLIVDEFKKTRSKRKLVIVGPLKSNDYIRGLLRREDNRIIFLGGIFDPSTQRMLRHNCFAYIHGHEVGGANPSLIEALSCKNVTLAFGSPYNKEVAEDAAIYFSKDQGDLQEVIDNLEASQSGLDERASLSYLLYKRKYTVEKMVDTLEMLIRRFNS